MTLKKSLSFALALMMVFSVLAVGFVYSASIASADTPEPREVLNFNTNWLYSNINYENGEVVGLDDSGFEKVSVPHANTILKTHKGDTFISEINSYRFVSWYRRHFTLPEKYADKRIMVDFEGIATVADVYLNGELLQTHEGAYTGFSVDITDYVYTDGRDNILAVRVDSTRQPLIPPEGGSVDYCLFGGIVRDVTMTITNPIYVERTFVTTPDLTDDKAIVKTQVDIKNTLPENKTYTIETTLLDADGNTVTTANIQTQLQANSSSTVEIATDTINNPHLWSVDDPYLYNVVTEIKDGDMIIDTYDTTIGMRYFEFKQGPDDGNLYLNGVKTKIVGINRHEQWPWIGRAVPDKLQVQDADLIKASGFNAVRCSHYPQDPSFLNRCDEIGLLVFIEPPGWQYIGNDEWKENFKTNLEELILRDRNHASIISWGARPNESRPDLPFNAECDALAKELDPTRPTHGVRVEYDYEGGDNDPVLNDIFTINYRYPEDPRYMPYIVTEHSNDWFSGAGVPGTADVNALRFIDSFATVLDYYYGNDKVAGGFGWSMFDYNNEVNYTNTGHVFYSGLYDLFRHDKPVAHLYKSQIDPDKSSPMVYIANNWTQDTTNYIYVLSNCDEIELFVNGVSKGRITPNKYMNMPHPIFEFTNIQYETGQLKAVGYIDGLPVSEFIRETPGEAVRLIATADYNTLTSDGTDMTSVTVTAVDENGNMVPFADNIINVSQIDGVNTTLISEENVALEGGRIAFFVQSIHNETGTAEFEVTSDGLASATCSIEIQPFTANNLVPSSEATGNISPIVPSLTVINDSAIGNENNQFDFQGTGWTYGSEITAYSGDNHWSSTAGDICNIKFNGSRIKYYGAKASSHGIAAFSIDGGKEVLIDCYEAGRNGVTLLFDSGYLTPGEHTLTVRVTGQKNAAATNYFVNADKIEILNNYPMPQAVVNDNIIGSDDLSFEYVGSGWGYTPYSTCYMGDNHWSNITDDYALFRFTGTGLRYFASKAPDHGIIAFSIDGGPEQTVDLYQANREDQVMVYDTGELTYGQHILKVRVTGQKNPSSTDCFLTVDEVEVFNQSEYSVIIKEDNVTDQECNITVQNTGNTPLDCIVIIAFYNENGAMIDKKLVSCNATDAIKAGETRYFTAKTDTPCSKVKAFVWDNNFIPLSYAFEKTF